MKIIQIKCVTGDECNAGAGGSTFLVFGKTKAEMEDQINGRGLGTHGVDALGVTCSEIDVLTFEEFEELYPKLVPPKRKLFNKKRKARSPKLQASLAKKRNAPRSP